MYFIWFSFGISLHPIICKWYIFDSFGERLIPFELNWFVILSWHRNASAAAYYLLGLDAQDRSSNPVKGVEKNLHSSLAIDWSAMTDALQPKWMYSNLTQSNSLGSSFLISYIIYFALWISCGFPYLVNKKDEREDLVY